MNFNTNALMNRIFRKVDGVCWDLMTGKIGIRTNDGIVTMEGLGDDAQININPFDSFSMAVPAFAQNTPTTAVQVGDLIYNATKLVGWVVERKDTENGISFRVIKTDGTISRWNPPKTQMLGFANGVMVLRSLINMVPDAATGGLSQMQQMMQMMMFMGGDVERMMPLMLMSQMGSAPIPTEDGSSMPNPLAGMNMSNMMQNMLMMQMMSGGSKGGKSPFGGSAFSNYFDSEDRG